MILVQDSLLTPLSEETLHPLDPGRGSPALPIPLELVDVLTKHVARSQGRYQVVKLGLVLPAINYNYTVISRVNFCTLLFTFWY